ncbi:MAG TPA: tetratricopeptide repeat protein, partial [Stellaceae bacterium]|nr:tetratricopeptide repeat protein [Stellaceae bacterium]
LRRKAVESERVQRRLAAILAADVAGYSRLIGVDEEGTIARLRALRHELIDPTIASHGGRIVKTTGDGILIEFASVVDAVRCAVEVQRGTASRNGDIPPEKRIEFRVGIHLGDVVVEGADLLGDGVNVAARLEGVAEPGGICISEDAYRQVRDRVASKFVDSGEQQFKNIAHPVRVYRLIEPASTTTLTQASLPLPDKPSIAVLAFANMSGDPEQEYFSDGIAEDIITLLSHSRSLFVIARNSSFIYKGRSVDVKQIARELGVRYVLEGSVRRGGIRVRVTAQLIEAETGNHLWAERYDRDIADVFAVQDEITEAVAIAIEPRVAEIERQRAMRKAPESLGAWEAYQRGLSHNARPAEFERAKHYYKRAIDLDPNFGAAYSELAQTTLSDATSFQSRDVREALDEALTLARQALSLGPTDAIAHSRVGLALTLRGDYAGGLAEGLTALSINPNLAVGHGELGTTLLFSGRPREAIDALLEALRRDPFDPARFVRLSHIALAHYYLREYDDAVDTAKTTIRSYPDHPWSYRYLAAALGQLGRIGEARAALQKAIAISPKSFDMHVRNRTPWVRPEDYEHMLEGLRKAGWES